MERIYQYYHKAGVEVFAIISGATEEYTRRRLPDFPYDYKSSYAVLDDPKNSVIALYGLSTRIETPQVLIIAKGGIVCYMGNFTPWMQMADVIELLRGKTEIPPAPLWERGDLEDVELVIQSLKNPDGYVRWKAAEALGWLGDETVVEALIKALADEVDVVRELAAKTLGEIGDGKAAEPLITALEDKSRFVRLEAVKALEWMTDERAIPSLTKSLAESQLRQHAANALATINKPELVKEALKANRAILLCGGAYELTRVYAELGRAYRERRMYDAAIAVYEKAANLTTSSYYRRDYIRNVVECHMEAGSLEKAATRYLKMVRSASAGGTSTRRNDDGTIERITEKELVIQDFVESFHKQGILGELTEILEAKIPELPEDVSLYEALASVYEKLWVDEEVILMSEKVAELQPHNMKTYARLALAYNRAGMRDKAVATVEDMAKRLPSDSYSKSLMSRVYFNCEMYDEGIASLKAAIQATPNSYMKKHLIMSFVEHYAGKGESDEVISLLSEVAKVEHNMEDKVLYIGLLIYHLHQAGAKEKIAQLAPNSFVREAESADTITGTLEIAVDEDASGGKFLWASEGIINLEGGGVATYNINVPEDGDYKIIARVLAPNAGSDSFFVRFDDSEIYYTWDPNIMSKWKWQVVKVRPLDYIGMGAYYSDQPISFPLSAGAHQFKLHTREDGTQIDVLVFYRL